MSSINKRAQQRDVEIISNKRVGAYHHMVFAAGEMAASARPGNFVAISVGGTNSSMILRARLRYIALAIVVNTEELLSLLSHRMAKEVNG